VAETPKIMKAILLKGYGGFDQLEYREDVPVPVPQAGEVLIRVAAAGINNTDINTRTGSYSPAWGTGWSGSERKFPLIQGADVCGRIVAVGQGIDADRIGQRVLVDPVLREPVSWRPYQALYLGSECDGGFAEYAKVPAVHAYPVESSLSDAELATFPSAYAAAENMISRTQVTEGDAVLITGASGGVGSAAVQLARRRGAKVMAVTSAARAEHVKSLGADRIILRDRNLPEQIAAKTTDVVIDVVGGPHWPQLLDALKRGGRYAVSGAIAGAIVELDLRTLYLKDLRLLGCSILEPEVFGNLVGYIERGEIKPILAKTFPLKDIVRAQQEFLEKGFVGKLVLLP
jgi:NADPH:quinone reductase-like Zn-dependent oxidoreductase